MNGIRGTTIQDYERNGKRSVVLFDDYYGRIDDLFAQMWETVRNSMKKGGIQPTVAERVFTEIEQALAALILDDADSIANSLQKVAQILGAANIPQKITDAIRSVFDARLKEMEVRLKEASFLKSLADSLKSLDIFCHCRQSFAALRSLILPRSARWPAAGPSAPSLWQIDIEIDLGKGFWDRQGINIIKDGIELAKFISGERVERPDSAGNWRPMPIFFLSKFDIKDHFPSGEPLSISQRTQKDVGLPWAYFHKLPATGEVEEQDSAGKVQRRISIQEYAAEVKAAALDGIRPPAAPDAGD